MWITYLMFVPCPSDAFATIIGVSIVFGVSFCIPIVVMLYVSDIQRIYKFIIDLKHIIRICLAESLNKPGMN